MKERVQENETAGTRVEVGGRKEGRVRQGEGGMLFVNPSTSGSY